jgi:hypothetical protein
MPRQAGQCRSKNGSPGELIGAAPFAIPGRGPTIVLVTAPAALEKIHLLNARLQFCRKASGGGLAGAIAPGGVSPQKA